MLNSTDIESQLYGLRLDRDKEIEEYLDNFIGMEYGIWPFSCKIKSHEDVIKFFKKYPEFNNRIQEINDKYDHLESIITSHGYRNNR